MQPSILDHINSTLYPPILSNQKELGLFFSNQTSIGYNDTISHLATLEAESLLTYNAYAAIKVFGVNKTHADLFDVGLGLHGETHGMYSTTMSQRKMCLALGKSTLPWQKRFRIGY